MKPIYAMEPKIHLNLSECGLEEAILALRPIHPHLGVLQSWILVVAPDGLFTAGKLVAAVKKNVNMDIVVKMDLNMEPEEWCLHSTYIYSDTGAVAVRGFWSKGAI